MVIYPVRLYYEPKEGEPENSYKTAIVEAINYPIVGLSIGIPSITGGKRQTIKYKINKQKWLEIFGADTADDFEEFDETIPEE